MFTGCLTGGTRQEIERVSKVDILWLNSPPTWNPFS